MATRRPQNDPKGKKPTATIAEAIPFTRTTAIALALIRTITLASCAGLPG